MKTIEEIRKALLVAKGIIEEHLEELDSITDEEEEEKGTVTLQLAYWLKHVKKADPCVVEEGSLRVEDGSFKRWAVATLRNGPLANKAFALNEEYDWELGKDEEDVLCLVPIKKDKLK